MRVPARIRRAHEVARKVRRQAYAPYSKFKVGAALVTQKGKIISGCNVENASYGGTVCAERVAILKAVSGGENAFSDVVVVTDSDRPAYPCALCLQVMAEFLEPGAKIWVADLKSIHSVTRFADLLPRPFGPKQLNEAK